MIPVPEYSGFPPLPYPFEPAGGAVPIGSPYYLERETDRRFAAALEAQESVVLIKGARQVGKTSLLARGLAQARRSGKRVVFTDLQKLNSADLDSLDSLYQTLGNAIADQLDLDVFPSDLWDSQLGPNQNFENFLKHQVIGPLDTSLVWALDEVDRLFTSSFSGELFGLIRAWHNERALDPDGCWGRLTLAISYATEGQLFITDMNLSPFNIGIRLDLEDFTHDQVAELNRRHGSPLASADQVSSFFGFIGGQPYLVRRSLLELAQQPTLWPGFAQFAARDDGIFGDHMRRIVLLVSRNPTLLEALREVLKGRCVPTLESFHRLKSGGVLAGDSMEGGRFRNKLYAGYLARHLA